MAATNKVQLHLITGYQYCLSVYDYFVLYLGKKLV